MVQQYQRQMSREIAPFAARTPSGTPSIRGVDYSPLTSVLNQWYERAHEELRIRAQENVEGLAQRAQVEAGLGGLAEAPTNLATRYQRMFDARARTVYAETLKADSARTASELSRAHRLDPEGFGAAWQEYAATTVEAIEQSDPTFASQVRSSLSSMGIGAQDRISQDVFSREIASQGAAVVESFQSQLSTARDYLLNNPSEQGLEEARAMLYTSLTDADNAGLLPPQTIAQMRMGIADDLAHDFVQGKANEAMANRDYRGARALVRRLRSGAWFDDNRRGERLAAQIESGMGGTGASAEAKRPHISLLSDLKSSAQLGIPLDGETVQAAEQSLRFIQAYGTPAEQEAAARNYHSALVLSQVQPYIRGASPDDLAALSDQMLDFGALRTLGEDTVRAVSSMVEAEASRQRAAVASGDLAALGDMGGVSLSELLTMDAEDMDRLIAGSVAVGSRNTGVATQRVPLFTNDQMAEFRSRAEQAIQREDTAQLFELVSTVLGPYQRAGHPRGGALLIAEQSPELGGAVIVSDLLDGAGGRGAAEWLNLAMQGQVAPQHDDISTASFSRLDSGVMDAVSGGSGAVAGAITATMRNVANGLLITGAVDTPRAAVDEANRLMKQVETSRLANGQTIPSRDLGVGAATRGSSLDAVNAWLRGQQGSSVPVESLRPVPVSPGVFRFRDTRTGLFYSEGSQAAPLELVVGEEEYAEAVQTDVVAMQEQAESMSRRALGMLDLATREQDNFITVGDSAGVPITAATALWRAMTNTPSREMVRMPDGVIPEVVDDSMASVDMGYRTVQTPVPNRYAREAARVLREEFRRQAVVGAVDARTAPQPEVPSQQEVRRAAAVLYLGDMLTAYGGDQSKALAAVYAGQEDVDAAIEAGGDLWLELMDVTVHQFIERGLAE